VKVIIADDGGDPGKHAAAVRRLITEEHVVAFVGDFAPLTFSAGVPTLESAGVAALGGDSAEAGWFRSPMAFPINDSTFSRSRPAAKWGLANLPQRKAAVFYVSEVAAPKAIADEFSRVWRAGGGQVVVDAGVSIAQPDFTAEVIRAKSAGADLVFMVLERAACNRFFSAARRQQFTPVYMAPACTIDTAVDNKDLTTNRLYGVSSARPLQRGHSPAEDEALDAAARYDPKMSPDGAFMFAWLGGKLLEAALAQPGAEPSAAGIVAALHRLPPTTLGGLTPRESWPPGPHHELGCGIITRFDGTRFVPMVEDFIC
jgi:branched-chain amino acid transport system substrate-binding protein